MSPGKSTLFNLLVILLGILYIILCAAGFKKCEAEESKFVYFFLSAGFAFMFLITSYLMEKELRKKKDFEGSAIGSSSGGAVLILMTYLYFKSKKDSGQEPGLKFYLGLISLIGTITSLILVFL